MRAKKMLRLLPYVAIGTIADCQSIVDPTNRAITKIGIQLIKNSNHGLVGLDTLINSTGIKSKMEGGYEFNSQDVAFTLSPILNSSGRISHARLSIMTLIGNDTFAFEAERLSFSEMSNKLIATNEQRKEMVKEVVNQIVVDESKNHVFIKGKWNKGIIGLIASRLVGKYNKPTAIISTPKSNLNEEEIKFLKNHLNNI